MKKGMRKHLSAVACILLTFFFISVFWVSMNHDSAMAADKIKLVLETGLVKTAKQTWGETAEPWTKAVTERTKDAVEFKCHFGGELVSMIDLVKGIGSGLVDVGAPFLGYYPSQFPMEAALGTLLYPEFTLEDPERVVITRVLYADVPAFSEAYTKTNIKKIFTISTPGQGIIATKPITKLSDFEGLKIRTFGKNLPKLVKASGAAPVSFAFTEVLDGLHKKVLDGTVINFSLARDMKLYEVAPYVVWLGPKNIPGHMIAYSYCMNLDKWNKLPANVKRIMLEEGKKVEMAYAEYSCKEQYIASKQMEEAGANISTLSEADLKEWAKRIGDIETSAGKELDEKGLPGMETMNIIKKLSKMSKSELMAEYDKAWEKEFGLIK